MYAREMRKLSAKPWEGQEPDCTPNPVNDTCYPHPALALALSATPLVGQDLNAFGTLGDKDTVTAVDSNLKHVCIHRG